MFTSEKKTESQPHGCCSGNLQVAKNLIELYVFPEKEDEKGNRGHAKPGDWHYRFCDYDPNTGMMKEPKYIGFYGDHEGRREGRNISFHQPTLDFEKELGDMLRYLVSHGYIQKKGSPQQDMLSPQERHKYQARAFGRQYPPSNDPFRCIVAHADHVEIINGTKKWQIPYAISDREWIEKTGWKI